MKWFGRVLALLFFRFFLISALKTDIITNIEKSLWISTQNLTTLLQVSFNTSGCCNVIIADNAVTNENIYNEFVRIYPYKYTLNSRAYDCTGYFMISTSANSIINATRIVPVTIASVELIIVLDDDLQESSSLFNVSVYRNANVKIAARNGIWILSENFLEPRIFKEASMFREIPNKQKLVDFQGRELQAAAVYDAPLCYLRSTVNRFHKGVEAPFFVATEPSELDGIEVQIFLLVAKRLNFTWKIRQGDLINRYGKRNGSHWSGGLIGQVYKKEVDVAFGNIWIQLDHYDFTNMTQPWTSLHLTFLAPRPKAYRSFTALVAPFSNALWAVIFAMLIVQSAYVFTRAWINPRISPRFRNFALTFTEMMGQLLGTWVPAKMLGLRLQFYLWHLIGILLVTAYSSNLAAKLTSSIYEKKIDTIQDMAEANLTWGSREIPELDLLFNSSDPYGSQIKKNFVQETSDDERHRKILNGHYAIPGRVIDRVFFPKEYVREEDLKIFLTMIHSRSLLKTSSMGNSKLINKLPSEVALSKIYNNLSPYSNFQLNQIIMKNFRAMNEVTGSFFLSYCVQPWLLQPLDTMLYRLRESGILHYQITSVIYRRAGSALRESTVEKIGNEGPQVLTMTPLGVGFSIIVLGLSLSTIVFFLELKLFKKKVSTCKLLREISRSHRSSSVS